MAALRGQQFERASTAGVEMLWAFVAIGLIFGVIGALLGQYRAPGLVGGAVLGFFLGLIGLAIIALMGRHDNGRTPYAESLYRPTYRGPRSTSASSPGGPPFGYANAPLAPQVVQPQPLQPGWHADPARRAGMRYFDGRTWTPHVLVKHPDGSTDQYQDPI